MDPGEQRLADQVNQVVVQRVQSITVESLRTGVELFVPAPGREEAERIRPLKSRAKRQTTANYFTTLTHLFGLAFSFLWVSMV